MSLTHPGLLPPGCIPSPKVSLSPAHAGGWAGNSEGGGGEEGGWGHIAQHQQRPHCIQ